MQVPTSDWNNENSAALLDLSFTGELAPEPPERVMQFHQTARRYMWLGKTLIGGWTGELIAAVDFAAKMFPEKKIILHGYKETAVASLFASVFSDKIAKVVMTDAPASYVFSAHSDFFGMAFFIPGFLKWGDIPLACALSNSELEWITPRNQDGSEAEVPAEKIKFFKDKL